MGEQEKPFVKKNDFSQAFQICIYCPGNNGEFSIIYRRLAGVLRALISIVIVIKLIFFWCTPKMGNKWNNEFFKILFLRMSTTANFEQSLTPIIP